MRIVKPSSDARAPGWRNLFRRGPWEGLAVGIIALGVGMLCQPFIMALYTYSFVTILAGVAMFTVVTKFPD